MCRTRLYLAGLFLVAAATACTDDAVSPPPVPAELRKVDGDGQTASIQHPLPDRVAVMVTDATGNGIPNVTVTFTVIAGDGWLDASEVATDARGIASVMWIVGDVVGANSQTLTASIEALPDAPVTFTASSLPPTSCDPLGADCRLSFGRTARLDSPSPTARPGLANNAPGSTYSADATGPYAGVESVPRGSHEAIRAHSPGDGGVDPAGGGRWIRRLSGGDLA